MQLTKEPSELNDAFHELIDQFGEEAVDQVSDKTVNYVTEILNAIEGVTASACILPRPLCEDTLSDFLGQYDQAQESARLGAMAAQQTTAWIEFDDGKHTLYSITTALTPTQLAEKLPEGFSQVAKKYDIQLPEVGI